MHRIYLAFLVFFRVLFGKPLPAEVLPAPEDRPLLPPPTTPVPAPAPIVAAAPAAPAAGPRAEEGTPGALQLLAMFQREGRLVDFLNEPLDGFSDADVGAAVRDIHRGCRKVLVEHFKLEPVLTQREEEAVELDDDFDAKSIRLVGNVNGKPPFRGVLRHHGWRVSKATMPKTTGGIDLKVVAHAEVELS